MGGKAHILAFSSHPRVVLKATLGCAKYKEILNKKAENMFF